jgi:hypothetical protein
MAFIVFMKPKNNNNNVEQNSRHKSVENNFSNSSKKCKDNLQNCLAKFFNPDQPNKNQNSIIKINKNRIFKK